jgi:membrane associated rhomboid family serine protease
LFFFPYKPDFEFFKTPWLTIGVCLACVLIFLVQQWGDSRADDAAHAYCSTTPDPLYEQLVTRVLGRSDARSCVLLMQRLRHAPDPRLFVEVAIVGALRPEGYSAVSGQRMLVNLIMDRYIGYEATVPESVTGKLIYPAASWDPLQMLTATFAHGYWRHLIGNMFFFFAFASAVEMLVGRARFAALFITIALGSFGAYSLTASAATGGSTLGLSGVVYGMLGLLAWLIPLGGIWWFAFFFGLIWRLVIPIWLMATWLVGIDIAQWVFDDGSSGVNLTAHISGALVGYACGALAFRQTREHLRAARPEIENPEIENPEIEDDRSP